MSPWDVLGWILVGVLAVTALTFVAVAGYAGLKIYREARQHHTDASLASAGVATACALCTLRAEYLTESGPRCSRHITARKPAGRKPYAERITTDV